MVLGTMSKRFGIQCVISEIGTVEAYLMSYVGPSEYTHLLIDKHQLTVSRMTNSPLIRDESKFYMFHQGLEI